MSAMERMTHRQSRGPNALAFDEPRGDPPPAPYTSGSTDPSSDDSIPLFLSGFQGQPDPQQLAPFAASQPTSILTRVVAGGLAVLALAILVAAINSDVTRTLVVNSDVARFLIDKVKAPMGGAPRDQSADQSATQGASHQPAVRQALLKDAASVSNPEPQSQIAAPRAKNEAAAPPRTLDAETLAALMTRARSLLKLGDIAAARLLLERAATAQDATAAFLLAQTYDPAVLGVRDTRSITPDPVMARDWYRKAAGFGSAAAQQRLTQFQN